MKRFLIGLIAVVAMSMQPAFAATVREDGTSRLTGFVDWVIMAAWAQEMVGEPSGTVKVVLPQGMVRTVIVHVNGTVVTSAKVSGIYHFTEIPAGKIWVAIDEADNDRHWYGHRESELQPGGFLEYRFTTRRVTTYVLPPPTLHYTPVLTPVPPPIETLQRDFQAWLTSRFIVWEAQDGLRRTELTEEFVAVRYRHLTFEQGLVMAARLRERMPKQQSPNQQMQQTQQ